MHRVLYKVEHPKEMWFIPYFVLLFLFISSVNSLQNSSYCSRVFPAEGTWLKDKPLWKISGCSSNSFEKNSTAECLTGRTIYVLGISTARQFVFSLASLLGDDDVDRLHQKALCKPNSFFAADCTRSIKGIKIKYRYFDFMDGFDYSERGGFPFLFKKNNTHRFNDVNEASVFYGGPIIWKDLVRNDVRKSLNAFFNKSTTNDILIFKLGNIYSSESEIIDFPAWLISSAKAFRNHVTATFKGEVVRVTMGQVHKDLETLNPLVNLTNYILTDVWNQENSKEWYTIDQWAINKGRESLYADRIHYGGLLTDATLQVFLNILCPQRGIPVVFPIDLPSTTEIVGKSLVINSGENFVVDTEGYLHQFENKSLCFQTLKILGSLNITRDVVRLLPKGSKVVEVCKNSSLIQPFFDKSVYLLSNNKLQKFANSRVFKSQGYDFVDVVKIPQWEFRLLQH